MLVNIRRPFADGDDSARTNLMATGWLVIKFVPALLSVPPITMQCSYRLHTLEDDTEGALADLLADSEMVADNAVVGRRRRRRV